MPAERVGVHRQSAPRWGDVLDLGPRSVLGAEPVTWRVVSITTRWRGLRPLGRWKSSSKYQRGGPSFISAFTPGRVARRLAVGLQQIRAYDRLVSWLRASRLRVTCVRRARRFWFYPLAMIGLTESKILNTATGRSARTLTESVVHRSLRMVLPSSIRSCLIPIETIFRWT